MSNKICNEVILQRTKVTDIARISQDQSFGSGSEAGWKHGHWKPVVLDCRLRLGKSGIERPVSRCNVDLKNNCQQMDDRIVLSDWLIWNYLIYWYFNFISNLYLLLLLNILCKQKNIKTLEASILKWCWEWNRCYIVCVCLFLLVMLKSIRYLVVKYYLLIIQMGLF